MVISLANFLDAISIRHDSRGSLSWTERTKIEGLGYVGFCRLQRDFGSFYVLLSTLSVTFFNPVDFFCIDIIPCCRTNGDHVECIVIQLFRNGFSVTGLF